MQTRPQHLYPQQARRADRTFAGAVKPRLMHQAKMKGLKGRHKKRFPLQITKGCVGPPGLSASLTWFRGLAPPAVVVSALRAFRCACFSVRVLFGARAQRERSSVRRFRVHPQSLAATRVVIPGT
ncbi:hypothetical protein FHS27_003401 [Rhodopirellula rubra]|uniref:Uncharacterized protein n=1 Tax=Aporhodopirellula rubra TaxID=980271 RepID=A0A7W5H745_9BACT|nr:hypothetical protein [Aporhodopirellula rubra]